MQRNVEQSRPPACAALPPRAMVRCRQLRCVPRRCWCLHLDRYLKHCKARAAYCPPVALAVQYRCCLAAWLWAVT